jgi:hypothetical protein
MRLWFLLNPFILVVFLNPALLGKGRNTASLLADGKEIQVPQLSLC